MNKKNQVQVASVTTAKPNLRAEIDGWSYEDSSLLVRKKLQNQVYDWPPYFIGHTPGADIPRYYCILEMLNEGWRLLGPPQEEKWAVDGAGADLFQYVWWLTRECPQ
jgi:hypothetical protein